MYEKYDSAACRLEQIMLSQGASATHIENMWQCVRRLRKDFSVKDTTVLTLIDIAIYNV